MKIRKDKDTDDGNTDEQQRIAPDPDDVYDLLTSVVAAYGQIYQQESGKLTQTDQDTETKWKQIRQWTSFIPDHDDPVEDQKKRYDQYRQQDDNDDDHHYTVYIWFGIKHRIEKRGSQGDEQQITVAVSASVFPETEIEQQPPEQAQSEIW